MPKPTCFGTSDVENLDGLYKGKCLMCGIEDECVAAYLGHVADEEERKQYISKLEKAIK